MTLRDETEWIETVESGWNVLAGWDSERIINAMRAARPSLGYCDFYGDGRAAERIVGSVAAVFAKGYDCATTEISKEGGLP
ncbi:MAG: hypothetical protein A2Z21_05085 [Candidatus Fraserbacteria bacterium RBG_16_55_9]|uniref:UDP-N-acetylglucosamine 2-epimerase domain-containing protein n=1 Tax=Fraserbacteria sp. (strain RBG_16_55_9) TaxID=1817864 RepID=A0A1F5UNB1_FRAXR|nr:MAG: hypothetical protein A2Z21_05085 [Candidatus Fraserbacteria bacterium RBG_16_55_9]